MAHKQTHAEESAKPRPPAAPRPRKNGGPPVIRTRSTAEARSDLMRRSAENTSGALALRSDPLADAKAIHAVVELARAHSAELARRGLSDHHGAAALELAREIEDHLQALPAAGAAARARSREAVELIADAAALVGPVREAVLRVTRGPEGRRAAHAFGIGDTYSARQPHHVLRALQRILAAVEEFPSVAADAGIVGEDLRTMEDLAGELEQIPPANGQSDEAESLHEKHGALRAYFDLLSAKGSLAFAADPEERLRLLALIPRSEDRRHLRRAASAESAAG